MRYLPLAAALLGAPLAADVPANVKAILDKSASFGLHKYPLSFWSYTNLNEHAAHMTEAEVQQWDDCGFTVPQSPSFDPAKPEQVAHMRRLLDWAQARGMKLILCDPRCNAHWVDQGGKLVVPAGYADGVRAAIGQFGDHPALFGFHVGDEPDAPMKDAFFECYRVQKQLAPQLHPFANLLPYFAGIEARAGTDTWPNYLDEYSRKSSADLLCYDCYVQMWSGQRGWDDYFNNLRLNREAALRNGIPFWNTVLSVGHYAYRCPSYDDLRWQFNTTVASGAHGLLWFFYYMRQPHVNYRLAPVDEHWDRTQTWWDIRRVQKSFHRFYGDLFTRIVCTKVMFGGTAFGGGEKFAPDDLVAGLTPEDAPALVSEFLDAEGRRYVMLVNLSLTDSRQIGLTFAGEKARYFSWDWYGHEYEGPAYGSSGASKDEHGLPKVEHFLAPGQEAVYRIDLGNG
ncbi:MAG: hypothetical protein HYU66_06670 [Armatimonadetes bacterium]|nr:hypothetical protein [Armatimonadota bacterium]